LDTLTGFVIATAMMLLNGGVLGLMHSSLPADVQPSARDWRIGTLLVAGGTILLATQQWLPLAFILPTATGFISLGISLYWRSVRRFCGRPDTAWIFLPVVLVVIFIYVFAAPFPNLNARIVVASAIWALVGVLAADTLRRYAGKDAVSQRVLAAIWLAVVIFMVFRIGYYLTHPGVTGSIVDSANWVNALTPLGTAVLPVIGTTAFLLMCSERIRQQWELAAATDYLTALPNRRMIMSTGEARFGTARRNGTGLAVAVIDIDHFKKINDEFGHDAGDLALKQVANVLAQHCRGPNMVGRQGGEEFVALLDVAHASEARAAAERLRTAVASMPFVHGDARHAVSVSIGIGIIDAEDRSLDDLLRRADLALYQAKTLGRNRVEMG
jgi:diguanylate cyclase (GGDEF)-like protein